MLKVQELSLSLKIIVYDYCISSLCIYYRPQRSCVQGYVFTRVCDSVHRGVLQAGRTPPDQADHLPSPPPGRREEPPTPGRETLPGPGRPHPPSRREEPPLGQAGRPPSRRETPQQEGEPPKQEGGTPPGQAGRPPPDQADPRRKQIPEYGLRAAGMHPTGMHSCLTFVSCVMDKLTSLC